MTIAIFLTLCLSTILKLSGDMSSPAYGFIAFCLMAMMIYELARKELKAKEEHYKEVKRMRALREARQRQEFIERISE